MSGKKKCKILKEIRQRIAKENDIPLVTRECSYQGECSGTCPRCEAELRYLEQQLARRQQLGKVVTVAALSLSLMASASGCVDQYLVGKVPYVESTDPDGIPTDPNMQGAPTHSESIDSTTAGVPEISTEQQSEIPGEAEAPESTEDWFVLGQVPAESTQSSDMDGLILEGDVAYIDPSENGND